MKILYETTLGQVADQVNAEEVISHPGDIEDALDDMLEVNLANHNDGSREFVNLLLTGRAGVGKTARVKSWARRNNINLVSVDAKGLDVTDLNGAIVPDKTNTTIQRLANTELDDLNKPRSVLFLDEFNRAPHNIRGTLLTLINDHELNDPRTPSKKRYLENFLFTVAAINPATGAYVGTDRLDAAERERFFELNVIADPENTLSYLEKEFYPDQMKAATTEKRKKEIEGKLKLARTLLTSSRFTFDNDFDDDEAIENQTAALSPRSLTKCLELSRGTKEGLLKYWNGQCNPRKKDIIEQILANYEDVDDKATQAIKGDTSSDIFKTDRNAAAKNALRAKLGL